MVRKSMGKGWVARGAVAVCSALCMLVLMTQQVQCVREIARTDAPVDNTAETGYTYHKAKANKSAAFTSRYLIHQTTWGVLSTKNASNEYPVGGITSHSDGYSYESTGRLLFYLTPLDGSVQNILKDPKCSYTVSLAEMNQEPCTSLDPENPMCMQVTISGEMKQVPKDSEDEVKDMLFARHPEMAEWPAGHGFSPYELHPSVIRLLSHYGGAEYVSVDTYFEA